eukprot:2233385-Prymnesium_polylepis.1
MEPRRVPTTQPAPSSSSGRRCAALTRRAWRRRALGAKWACGRPSARPAAWRSTWRDSTPSAGWSSVAASLCSSSARAGRWRSSLHRRRTAAKLATVHVVGCGRGGGHMVAEVSQATVPGRRWPMAYDAPGGGN